MSEMATCEKGHALVIYSSLQCPECRAILLEEKLTVQERRLDDIGTKLDAIYKLVLL